VLVAGGAGFAGSYVVRDLLDAGYRVVVLDVAPYRTEARFVIGQDVDRVPFVRCSVDNWSRVIEAVITHRPAGIVNLAMIMDVQFLDDNPLTSLDVNVRGAVALLEAARLTGVQRFVQFSTIGVIPRWRYQPIDSDHPTVQAGIGPLGMYSVAKLCCEAYALGYHQTTGLDTRVVRPSAVYGFGMSWAAPNYMKNILEPAALGDEVRLRAGGPVPRDYTNVVDVAGLTRAVLEGPDDADRVFYAATGQPLRTGSDVGTITRQLVPGAIVEIPDEWTDVDRGELPFRARISIENATGQLGWAPRFARLEDGMADYLTRFRAFLGAGGSPTPPPSGMANAPGSG
jgi:nucleoside-diphosphate-sugar epimerase